MSKRDIEKQVGLRGIFRLLIVMPGDVRDLFEDFLVPFWQSWRRPNFVDYDDDEAYDLEYEAVTRYRKVFTGTLRRALWDKHCTRHVVGIIFFLFLSIWMTCRFVGNFFSGGHVGWLSQLIIFLVACALFMLARNSWHNVAKCVIIADDAAMAEYIEFLDLDDPEPEPTNNRNNDMFM